MKKTANKSKAQSLAPLITEAERVLREAIKHHKLSIPPELLVVTIQSHGRRNAVGWFWAKRWQRDKGKTSLHEINMSAEWLQKRSMGELLLHELAHAENDFKKIKDCAGRVHNKHFKTMAESLGLEVKPRDKRIGYGYTDLAEGGKTFLKKIAFKQELFDVYRATQGPAKGSVGSRLVKIECGGCGYVARTTAKWLGTGLPTCCCGEEFEIV